MASTAPQTGHIGLNVTHLEQSISFYQQVFGFGVMQGSRSPGRRFAYLGDGERIVLTLWEQAGEAFNKDRAGLHHLSFQVSTIEEVKAAEGRLRAVGARFVYDGIVPHTEGADSGGIFFEDPDGIRLEIYASSGAGKGTAPVAGAPSCSFF